MTRLSRQVVRSFLTRKERGIPREVIDKTIVHIADEVGPALAGRVGAPAAPEALTALHEGVIGGKCQVIGGGPGLPPALAAFANSAFCHAMDFDDIHDTCHVHATSTTFPAALAASDLVGGASGKTVVEAVALGNELMCRMAVFQFKEGPQGHDVPYGADFYLSQLHGYFAAALTAGLILGLDEERLVSAFGLAYMQAAGTREPGRAGGCNARAIYTGFGAMGGVQAALFAKHGVTGPDSAFDGSSGLYKTYIPMPVAQERIERLLQTEDWDFLGTNIRPYPTARGNHLFIAAALSLRDKVPLDRIEKIVAEVGARYRHSALPLEARRRPKTVPDAKYGIPFAIGFALANGKVTLNNLNESALHDEEALRLAGLVEVVMQSEADDNLPGNITIHYTGGSVESPRVGFPSLSNEQLRAKFLDCCEYAGLGNEGPALYDRLLRIEDGDVSKLMSEIKLKA